MFIRNWKKEILTLPNFLSLFRLGLIPVYVILYCKAQHPRDFWTAGAVLAASCLTDALDGYIARHFHMVSHVGKILDPLADKATQLALTICLCLKYPVLYPVLALFLVKESFQLTAGIVYLRRGKMLPGALPAGKLCTAVFFASLIALVLFPELDGWIVKTLALIDGSFLLLSFVSYILAYCTSRPQDIRFQ